MPLSTDDIVAIQQLVARYCHAADSGDAAGYVATFTEDGFLKVGDREAIRGRAALGALFGPVPRGFRHVVTNVLIDGDGDHATSKAYFSAMPRGGGLIASTGVYSDTILKTSDGWLFSGRHYTPDEAPAAG